MPLLQQVLEKYPNDVKLVFKNLPLSMHKFARKAATAALAANDQGKYWEFHDKLFQNQSALSDATVQKIAEELGLDAEKFNKDIQGPAIQELIGRDVKDAQQAGITGTPTILVNGRLLKKRSLAGFQEMIDAELKKPKEMKEIEGERSKTKGAKTKDESEQMEEDKGEAND
ncbi:thioredoxin domain-containing protein [Candidatus Poribacteria bacterium]|nr:thioredoxin domain-containing protein [Candidatus Poribacteria bacterium]